MIGICKTNGTGFWSNVEKEVAIIKLCISYVNMTGLLDSDNGELRVYFDTTTWDISVDGFIYSDKQWMENFRKLLISLGFSKKAVTENVFFSEMGMQGNDYVSLDVFKEFLIECDKMVNFTKGKQISVDIELGFL